MGKKTYDTDGKREYFNETSYGDSKKLRKRLLKALNEVAIKYDAAPIALRNQGYIGHFHDRDWSWRAEFFRHDLEMVESTHNKWPERIWLDHLIRQAACMVWNLAHGTVVMEYKNGGHWALATLAEAFPKKQRGEESVAENLANKEKEKFCLKFK